MGREESLATQQMAVDAREEIDEGGRGRFGGEVDPRYGASEFVHVKISHEWREQRLKDGLVPISGISMTMTLIVSSSSSSSDETVQFFLRRRCLSD